MAGEILGTSVAENISLSKILVVGAGGIGCELLKNLAHTGFTDITVVCQSYRDKVSIENLGHVISSDTAEFGNCTLENFCFKCYCVW